MSSREISGPVTRFVFVVSCLWSSELSFLTIAIPGRRFSLHVAILFLTACNHDLSSGDSFLCSQYLLFVLCVRFILASGRLRNSSTTCMLITSGIVGPRHGISVTFRCHEFVDGLMFPTMLRSCRSGFLLSSRYCDFDELAGLSYLW